MTAFIDAYTMIGLGLTGAVAAFGMALASARNLFA